jgi:hypothetical protein
MSVARPGIVDLRDLASRRAWDTPKLEPSLAAIGLVPEGEVRRCLRPPRVIVAIASHDAAWMVKRTRPWLSAAEHVIVCRDPGTFVDYAADPDLLDLIDEEWRDATEGWVAKVVDHLATALGLAEAALQALPPRAEMPLASPVIDELPVSPWNRYEPERFDFAFLDRVERRGDEIVIAPAKPRPPLTPEEARHQRSWNPGFLSLGADPIHRPVGWRGDRMHVYWTWEGQFFTSSDHDYPCGPGKKLWGYEDNDPVQVTLAPDASAYAARFGHDVLLTRAVPLPWQRAGAFDAVVRVRDPWRAVFYAQDPERDSWAPRPEEITDEDGRDCAPVLVLAPSLHYALDLSLRVYRVMNAENGDAEKVQIGGPNEGFAVFDGEHRLVRRASGKLIGGWYRWATIEENGAYWREDLVTGERIRMAPIDLAISDDPTIEAVARDAIFEGQFDRAMALRGTTQTMEDIVAYALPGTKNVLLVSKQHVRVI